VAWCASGVARRRRSRPPSGNRVVRARPCGRGERESKQADRGCNASSHATAEQLAGCSAAAVARPRPTEAPSTPVAAAHGPALPPGGHTAPQSRPYFVDGTAPPSLRDTPVGLADVTIRRRRSGSACEATCRRQPHRRQHPTRARAPQADRHFDPMTNCPHYALRALHCEG
jgi:hypothetical protein